MRASLALIAFAALLSGPGGVRAAAPDPASTIASVIPMPAEVATQPGAFSLRDGVAVAAGKDAQTARIAAYFTGLLRDSHGLHLKVHSDSRPQHGAIAFVLDPKASGASAESYQLEVQ